MGPAARTAHWRLLPADAWDHALTPHAGAPVPAPAARRVRYLSRVLDASFNVLFDGRRRTTHTLVYNYFMASWGCWVSDFWEGVRLFLAAEVPAPAVDEAGASVRLLLLAPPPEPPPP